MRAASAGDQRPCRRDRGTANWTTSSCPSAIASAVSNLAAACGTTSADCSPRCGRKNGWQLAEQAGHRTPTVCSTCWHGAALGRRRRPRRPAGIRRRPARRPGRGPDHRRHRVHQEGHHLRRGPAPVLRHRRPHRELPDRRLRRLRHQPRAGPWWTASSTCPSPGPPTGTLPGGEDPRRAGVRHQGRTGQGHGAARASPRRCPSPGSPRMPPTARNGAFAGCWNKPASATCWPCPKSQQSSTGRSLAASTTSSPRRPDEAWERLSCGDGAKGPRVYDWAAAQLPAIADFDGERPPIDRWVLARRSITSPTRSPTTSPTPRRHRRRRAGARSPGAAGRSRSASRPRRTSAAWTSTRSAATSAGTGTSPWPCSPTPSSPPWPPPRRRKGGRRNGSALSCRSPWRKSGGSWQLASPADAPAAHRATH